MRPLAFGMLVAPGVARGLLRIDCPAACHARRQHSPCRPCVRMCATESDAQATKTKPTAKPSGAVGTKRKRMKISALQDAQESIVGEEVNVKGWLRTVRDQKKFAFLNVNDGSTLAGLQIVVDASTPAYDIARTLSTGSSVSVHGTVVSSPGVNQKYEVQATDVELLCGADSSFPLQKKRHSFEFLRGIAHLRARTNSIGAVARVRSTLAQSTHRFFEERGFLYVHTPVVTASDCEGAGEMFQVTTLPIGDPSAIARDQQGKVDFGRDFFARKAYLTVSGQLGAEAYACALSDVYTFGPTFRAENSNTLRHLAEFWMIEPEMAFADLDDDMDNAEAYIKYCIRAVLERRAEDIDFFDKFVSKGLRDRLQLVLENEFARVSYTEAVELLSNAKPKPIFEYPVSWGIDLQTEHERWLSETHFQRPVFVYDYPKDIKAFYMRLNDDNRTVSAMDLLVPVIGELIGGSQREERLNILEERIEELNLDKEAYWWYLDLRRYGSVPHSGYGLGFERLVQFATGMENIRDVIPFPRHPGRADF